MFNYFNEINVKVAAGGLCGGVLFNVLSVSEDAPAYAIGDGCQHICPETASARGTLYLRKILHRCRVTALAYPYLRFLQVFFLEGRQRLSKVVNGISECSTFAVLEDRLFTAVQSKTFSSAREKFLLCTPVNRESQSNSVINHNV